MIRGQRAFPMSNKPKHDLDPFAADPLPCPYAAEGKCPLVKEDPRGMGHLSMITLGQYAECPGHNAFDMWGGPHFGGLPKSH